MVQKTRYVAPPSRRRKKRAPDLAPFLCTAAVLTLSVLLCWKAAAHTGGPAGPGPTAPPAATGPDTAPPVLTGVHDITVYQGGTVSYLFGVTAQDDTDPAPAISVDSTAVNTNLPGKYTVRYTARDAAGNTAWAAAVVTVMEKKDGYVELEQIDRAADEKLGQILPKNATTRQQVEAIYTWARKNLTYGGHSDRTDWHQTAYQMLQTREGDCFGYFAVTKLLLERLGIPNQDVQKVRNFPEDSDHFWSLVSLDGGKTWYHFDATPRKGTGDDFCLVTDAFLDDYSEHHKGSHHRDKSLYPATP